MTAFAQSTGKIAAWNLAGGPNRGIPVWRRNNQVEGLALLDAEIVALVEINPLRTVKTLKQGLGELGVEYKSVHVEQENKLHIGVLYKDGVVAGTPSLLDGSDLGDSRNRKALVVDMQVGQFDFKLIVVHLKSARGADEQKTRDEQCKVIADFISEERARNSRRAILLMGDFNMIPGQDVSNFHHLGGDDVMDFVSSWDLQARFSHILP